tara:strand:+ start:4785 stop:5174 length:390 start_codon:yes stop_codon:yes gene_type:complete
MPNNELHHNRTLSNLNTNAKYAKWSRKWSRYGRNGETYSTSAWQDARKAYNRAVRRASKLQLSKYQNPCKTQQELDNEYYAWEEDRYMQDMDWTISRDERLFNAEVRGYEAHLRMDENWREWNKEYDRR